MQQAKSLALRDKPMTDQTIASNLASFVAIKVCTYRRDQKPVKWGWANFGEWSWVAARAGDVDMVDTDADVGIVIAGSDTMHLERSIPND